MKIKHITRLAVVVLLFLSCTGKDRITESPCAEGTMRVVVTQMDGVEEDRISTIRFIVFGDPDTDPTLEVNRLFGESEFETDDAEGDGGVSQLNIVLEVMRKVGVQNNKLVVVIANEPPSMTALLDDVTQFEELEEMRLDFAEFLNDDHRTLIDDYPLPMTAAVWTDKVYATEQEATDDMVSVELNRAVARVDVYMEFGEDAEPELMLTAGTSVTLANTYDNQYFIYHTDGTNTLGQIQTVASGFISKVWELTEDIAATDSQLLCSFYTPERTCSAAADADKLTIEIVAVTSEGAVRQGSVVINSGILESTGVAGEITTVGRNNVYRVTASMGLETMMIRVNDWNTEDIYNEL